MVLGWHGLFSSRLHVLGLYRLSMRRAGNEEVQNRSSLMVGRQNSEHLPMELIGDNLVGKVREGNGGSWNQQTEGQHSHKASKLEDMVDSLGGSCSAAATAWS